VTDTVTDTRLLAAAQNNATWCDLVCCSHEVRTITSGQFWVALQRTPPQYPDAVTLTRRVLPRAVLKLIQDSPGASIKDSFADLDLTAAGYSILFEAEWIFCEPGDDSTRDRPAGWSVISTAEALATWSAAAGLGHLMRPDMIGHPDVRVLAQVDEDGQMSGAILNRSGSVVGVSNVFRSRSTRMDAGDLWTGVIGSARACFPGLALCGYEHGADLDDALHAGFTAIGPLRIWGKP
jgi:hypothetical protein